MTAQYWIVSLCKMFIILAFMYHVVKFFIIKIRQSQYFWALLPLIIPLFYALSRMFLGVASFPWGPRQFIFGNAIILLFTILDLLITPKNFEKKTQYWWKFFGWFDYFLFGIIINFLTTALIVFVFDLGIAFVMIGMSFMTFWFMFLGCLQTRNKLYTYKLTKK